MLNQSTPELLHKLFMRFIKLVLRNQTIPLDAPFKKKLNISLVDSIDKEIGTIVSQIHVSH